MGGGSGVALDAERWTASSHVLGRGRFDPANAVRSMDGIRLTLPAGRCDGAEVVFPDRLASGLCRAEIRAADAPGSLTALFLYEGVPGEANDEIDIEIPGDDSRRVLLSTWRDGVQTNLAERLLPFDPRAGSHDYAIAWRPGEEVRFVIDGIAMERWTAGIPTRPMQLRASVWRPAWLGGGAMDEDRYALVIGPAHFAVSSG
jgi:hypothetical protein